MAIFGDLSDLPFPEIFNMVGRRTGRLLLYGLKDLPVFELELQDGALRGLTVGEEKIADPLLVRDRMAVLMEADRGTFELCRCEPSELRGGLHLSIPSLLMALASAVDEIGAYRDRFAHPSTRFRMLGAEDVWLDDDLYLFAERARPLLLRGAAAEELSRELGVSLEQVQLYLYKLRSVGRVAPVRAFEEEELVEAEVSLAFERILSYPSKEEAAAAMVAFAAPAPPAEPAHRRRPIAERAAGLLRSLRNRLAFA